MNVEQKYKYNTSKDGPHFFGQWDFENFTLGDSKFWL